MRALWIAAVAAGLAMGGSAFAQEAFDVEEAAAVCATCHGEDGVPVEPDTPVIWGQQFYYTYVQLRDYNSGLRANEVMQPIVADFDRDQLKALATHFSEKAWPDIPATPDPPKRRRRSPRPRPASARSATTPIKATAECRVSRTSRKPTSPAPCTSTRPSSATTTRRWGR